MSKNKIEYLKYYDILFITLIMFGTAIYDSTLNYIDLKNGIVDINENLTFSFSDNIYAIKIELLQLTITFIYLYYRKFDFSKWKFKLNLKIFFYGIIIYIFSSIIMDLSSIIFKFNDFSLVYTGEFEMFKEFINELDLSLILFSILNGFFEEIFFLGICLSVDKKYIKYVFIYSLLIRTSFHTYQDIGPALTIGLGLGILYYFVYTKYTNKNLAPIIISHIIADILGLGLIEFILY